MHLVSEIQEEEFKYAGEDTVWKNTFCNEKLELYSSGRNWTEIFAKSVEEKTIKLHP